MISPLQLDCVGDVQSTGTQRDMLQIDHTVRIRYNQAVVAAVSDSVTFN